MTNEQLLNSLQGTGPVIDPYSVKKEARDGMLNKLQKIMSEMEVELSVEKPND